MSFWSGESLLERLPDLISPFKADHIDCAAYQLTIGHEVYVTPTDETPDPKSRTKKRLSDLEAFTIPPGQFAFLLTEEIVTVPPGALGFISIRARIKFRGLVNVSGFHVDPGFKGRLVFSVYNAGPATIHLQQGEQCFLIWYASLDRSSKKVKTSPVQESISPDLINSISGELQSLEGLAKKIRSIQHEQTTIKIITTVLFAAVVGAAINLLVRGCESPSTQPLRASPTAFSTFSAPTFTPPGPSSGTPAGRSTQ